ncbi:MAG: ferritin [Lentisphaerae bacterium]|jgi:ferritin|nr:ferritin [Lentisphaerota bacterium]
MINDKMTKALNVQMNKEFYNSRLYLSMATFFHDINMDGAASWMEKQAEEETEHAMKLYNYLKDRGARILLTEVPAPPTSWASPLAAFEDAYKHECDVTKEIDDLVELARSLKDNATLNFLQWFVDEQVEEEASTDAVVQKLKMASQGGHCALFFMDRMLGER